MAVNTENGKSPDNVLPFSLAMINDRLAHFHAPVEPFDADGPWEHRYTVWVAIRGPAGASWDAGTLSVCCRPRKKGVDLDLTQLTILRGTTDVAVTRAEIQCADDDLSSPCRWNVRSGLFTSEDKIVANTRTEISGNVPDREANRHDRLTTSNWSLFHAFARLHVLNERPSEEDPLEFDMLEDLELPKPRQRLWFQKTFDLELGGNSIRLYGWKQIGHGILPYTYWLDKEGRLLFAVGNLKTYVWNPDAQVREVAL